MQEVKDFFNLFGRFTLGGPGHLSASLRDRNHDHGVIRTAIRSTSADVARVAMESHIVSTVATFENDLDDTA
jgi:DNA-binding GntR family transcriptional regulator